ncbi:MAG TPA: LCP family protein [Fimbriimonadaceae bacterium]|nr:LCP family protein [Fimbriimonadaceae bacterium]HRJ95955.1 LCP family protein [Fimbriimonadaceae bacterium]
MAKDQKQPLWKKILKGTAYVALCAFAIGAGTILGYVGKSPLIQQIAMQRIQNTPPEEIFREDTVNVLLLGCDEDRAHGGKKILRQYARSDMMLVARLDFKTKQITGVSIPRDTLADLPGYREQKINAYHSIGGKDLAKRAVEKLLGLSIDKVIVLDYQIFQDVVDMVGGVDVFIDKKLKYTDRRGGLFIDLKPGLQHLDGYNAMCFVRYRHGDSDFARQARQKDFLLAMRDAVRKNPVVIGDVANKAAQMLEDDFTIDQIAAIVNFAQKIGSDNIRMGQIPVFDAPNYNLRVDRRNLRKTLEEFDMLDGEPTTVSYN